MYKKKFDLYKLVLIIILSGAFIIRVYGAYFFPLDSDEDLYLSNARLMLQGWIPFKDFSGANQGPLYYFLLALFLKIGGVSIFAGRMLSVFSATITTFFIFKIGNILYGKKVGLLSCAIFAFSPFTVRYGYSVITEPLTIMFTSISIYLLILGFEKNKYKYFILNGIFLAMAVLVRRSVGFLIIFEPILIIIIYIFYSEYRKNIKSSVKNFFSVPFGFLLPFLPVLLYFAYNTSYTHINHYDPRNLTGADQFRELNIVLAILSSKALYLMLPCLVFLTISIKEYIFKSLQKIYYIFIATLGFCFIIFLLEVNLILSDKNLFSIFVYFLFLVIFLIGTKSLLNSKIFQIKNIIFKSVIILTLSLVISSILLFNHSTITNQFLIDIQEIILKILLIFLLSSLFLWILKKVEYKFPFSKKENEQTHKTDNSPNKEGFLFNFKSNIIKKCLIKKFLSPNNLIIFFCLFFPILLFKNRIENGNDDILLKIFLVSLIFAFFFLFTKKIEKKFSNNITYFYITSVSIFGIIVFSNLINSNILVISFLKPYLIISIFSFCAFYLTLGLKISQKVKFGNLILIFWFFSMIYFYARYQFMPVYFSELAPVACIMTGVLIYSLYNNTKISLKKSVHIFVSLLIFSAIFSQAVYANDWYFSVEGDDVHPKATTIRNVGKYLSEHTSSDEEICSYPIYAFEANRKVIFNIVYMVAYDNLFNNVFGKPHDYGYPEVDEIIAHMNETKLRYVVIDPMFETYVLFSHNDLKWFIESHYELEIRIENVDIMVWKTD